MKKALSLILVSTVLLSACGTEGDNSSQSIKNDLANNTTSATDIIENSANNMYGANTAQDNSTSTNANTADTTTNPFGQIVNPTTDSNKDYSSMDNIKADIDITKLTNTLAFAQVSNMMYPYHSYLGKTIKIKGQYYGQSSPDNSNFYHFVLLIDDTNCCQGVLEFRLPDGVSYPTIGSEIMIYGEYITDTDETGEYPIIEVTDYVI